MTAKFYHPCDPAAPKPNHAWHYVYLHGQAESRNDQIAHLAQFWSELPEDSEDRPWAAPDLFRADEPMPTEPGEYRVTHYGVDLIVVLARQHNFLGGRAAYGHDIDGLKHARTPGDWR